MSGMFKTIGVIAALPEEADALFADLGERAGSSRTVQIGDRSITIKVCGIGKVNAALAASALALDHKVEMLFVIGTAGALGPRHGTFLLTEAVQTDYGARQSQGFVHYRAGEWPIGPASCPPFVAMAVESPLAHARIATGDAFVECPEHAAYLRDVMGCDLIDMETGAVAQAAVSLGVPWAGIKATTDGADGSSAGDFTANLLRASRAAADAAEPILRSV
jgi:adenosylhomocysteine nucleosidase